MPKGALTEATPIAQYRDDRVQSGIESIDASETRLENLNRRDLSHAELRAELHDAQVIRGQIG
jgi:hypothetical protein